MRYEAKAAIAMGCIIGVAAIGFVGLRSAMAPPMRAFPLSESTDSFTVRNPEFIRPDSATYAQFAVADAEWRRRYAAPRALADARGHVVLTSGGSLWRPSPRQVVDDQVYAFQKANRLDSAIAVLTAWVDRHPADRDELLKLARLLNQAGRGDASVARYRQLLALETARGR
jgi:hypothetical protein